MLPSSDSSGGGDICSPLSTYEYFHMDYKPGLFIYSVFYDDQVGKHEWWRISSVNHCRWTTCADKYTRRGRVLVPRAASIPFFLSILILRTLLRHPRHSAFDRASPGILSLRGSTGEDSRLLTAGYATSFLPRPCG